MRLHRLKLWRFLKSLTSFCQFENFLSWLFNNFILFHLIFLITPSYSSTILMIINLGMTDHVMVKAHFLAAILFLFLFKGNCKLQVRAQSLRATFVFGNSNNFRVSNLVGLVYNVARFCKICWLEWLGWLSYHCP